MRYRVTLRNAAGRERVISVYASTDTQASNKALLAVIKETGERDWLVAYVAYVS